MGAIMNRLQTSCVIFLFVGSCVNAYAARHGRFHPLDEDDATKEVSAYIRTRPGTGHADQHHHYHAPVHVYMGDSSEEDSSELSEEDGWGKTETGTGSCATGQNVERTWIFQVGDYFGPWEFIDENGYVKGFHIDLIQAVCRQAGKKCFYVLDKFQHCWDTSGGIEIPGVGLLDRWYDGCVGLFPSPERLNSFNFTLPFSPNFKTAVHYKAGQIPDRPYDLTGRRVGFIEGWAVGKACLARQAGFSGNQEDDYIPVMYETHDDLITGLQLEEVDAILNVNLFDEAQRQKMGIEAIEPWFSCTTNGASIMARYDNPVIEWWNAAFQDLMNTGAYSRLCLRAKDLYKHKGMLFCEGEALGLGN